MVLHPDEGREAIVDGVIWCVRISFFLLNRECRIVLCIRWTGRRDMISIRNETQSGRFTLPDPA
jgi:hypothetical protein